LYPNNQKNKVKISKKRPNPKIERQKGYGFAEGSFKNKKSVITRLNAMNISVAQRPKGYQII